MITQAPSTVTLDAVALQELRSRIRGELIQAGDDRYEQDCHVYNAMHVYNTLIDRR